MGWKLVVEVLDQSPEGLTWRERYALVTLANAAWDTGRRARQIPGIEDNPKLIERLRLPGRASRFEVLQGLVAKAALERVERGRHGTGATYAIPDYAAKRPAFPDATEASKGPGTPDASRGGEGSGFHRRRVRVSPSKGPGTPDPLQTSTRPVKTDTRRPASARNVTVSTDLGGSAPPSPPPGRCDPPGPPGVDSGDRGIEPSMNSVSDADFPEISAEDRPGSRTPAGDHGVPPTGVCRNLGEAGSKTGKPRGPNMSAQVKHDIFELHDRGATAKEIAAATGYALSTVYRRLAEEARRER